MFNVILLTSIKWDKYENNDIIIMDIVPRLKYGDYFMNKKIIIVEDSEDIREIVKVLLEEQGYHVIVAENGEEGLELIESNNDVDLLILDVMLPGMSGFEVCKELRGITTAPILFLSAKSLIEDKEMGLEIGGDDYLPKPFSTIELLARVKALLRRYEVYQGKFQNPTLEVIFIRDLRIHLTSGEVWLNDSLISLRHMEYELLLLLAKNRGSVLSAQKIYESIWQDKFLPVSNNVVAAHIKNLRQKIEINPKKPTYIMTVWGKGYYID